MNGRKRTSRIVTIENAPETTGDTSPRTYTPTAAAAASESENNDKTPSGKNAKKAAPGRRSLFQSIFPCLDAQNVTKEEGSDEERQTLMPKQ